MINSDLLKTKVKNYLDKNFSKVLTSIFLAVFLLLFSYSYVRENLSANLQLGYYFQNNVVNSVVVALDGIFNPDSVLATAASITEKIAAGEGMVVEDVYRRCYVQSENRVSDAYFQLYDTKAGVNNGDTIGGGGTGQEVRDYLRWNNRSSLDLQASQMIGIVSSSTTPANVVDFIKKSNEDGFIPIIRLCVADLGDCAFPMPENADSLVNFFDEVGRNLMNENKGYRAVLSLGVNEPHTGNYDLILQTLQVPDYKTMVQRENQAASRLQKYRVVNGGVFWLAPAIFNGTESFQADGREYSYDVYHHLYVGGADNTDKNYWTRPNIDPDLFDAMLVNVYSVASKTAYGFYREFGLKEYVDRKPNLVTLVTEFGVAPGNDAMTTEDIKDDFKELCNDDKIEGISYFRALKDKPSIPPMPNENQRLELADIITYTEQCNKTAKKISLKVDSWLNCNLPSALYSKSSSSSGSSGRVVSSKGGLNQGNRVTEDQSLAFELAKATGLSGYSLAIATHPTNDVGPTLDFISKSINAGMVPIIRLCFSEGENNCSFNAAGGNPNDIVNFFSQVRDGASGTFIAIVGANEPASEFGAFNAGSIEDMARATNSAAQALGKSGKMLMAPAAFNLVNLQVSELGIYKGIINFANFDVIIGNAYNMSGYSADTAIDEALNYAKSNGLKFIMTETGNIAGQADGVDFAQTAAKLCKKVDGFLLFRSAKSLSASATPGSNLPVPFEDEELKSISAACAGGGSTTVQVADTTDTNSTGQTAGVCTGGLADSEIIFVGDSLTNELVSGNPGSGVTGRFSASNNLGAPGASSAWFVAGGEKGTEFSGRLEEAVSNTQYKAVVLMFGTNDCGGLPIDQFKGNLTSIINNIKSKNSSIKIYISTIPRAHNACSEGTIDQYNSAIAEVRSATGVSIRELGGGVFSDVDLRDGDDRHLKDSAYERMAQITRTTLGATCIDSSTGNPATGATTAGATALMCGTENDKPASFYTGKNAAALRVKCVGGNCTTKKVGTIDIEAPIKLFSSSSPNGTLRLRYAPVSQIAATNSGNMGYDALNMFAGEIQLGGKSYPMPGLGSGINSAVEILTETMTERNLSQFSNYSLGSLTEVTSLKLQSQVDDNSAVQIKGTSGRSSLFSTSAFSVEDDGQALKSIDDRTVCFDGECFNNDNGLLNWRKNLLPYDSTVAYPSYIAPKACQSTNMKFINNLDDYVTGPELVVDKETTVYSGTTQNVCGRYSGRNLQGSTTSGDGVKSCGYVFDQRIFPDANVGAVSPDEGKPWRYVNEQVYDPILGQVVIRSRLETTNWLCKDLFDGVGYMEDGTPVSVPGGPRLPKCDFDDYEFEQNKGQIDPNTRSGNCQIQERYWNSCLRYDPRDSDQIYIHTEAYPNISKARMPEMYSSIYSLYDRLQTMMSKRNMKIVFQENIGVKIKINSKIRDANETITQQDYRYAKTFDTYSTLPDLIDNDIPLAQNNSTKTQFQYFDDLGYLNLLQEYIVAYANEQSLIGDNIIDNPFIGQVNPLPGRSKIVAGGLSNMALSNPILTCDQVEICKKYTYDDLRQTFGDEKAARLCPLNELLPADTKKNCITNIGDERYIDRLGDTLCARGFKVKADCKFMCEVNNEGSGGSTPIPEIISGVSSVLFPVSNSRQIPNCSEPATVQPVNTDLRVFNDDNDSTISLIPEAKQSLESMLAAMKSENSIAYANCALGWGYRSAARQGAFSDACTSGTACKCHSEHQLGTTLDFRSMDNPQLASAFAGSACQQWVAANAHKYGFIQSYTGADPDYIPESWHYRYIGVDKAQEYMSKQSEFGYLRKYLESLASNPEGNASPTLPGDFKVRWPTDFETVTGNYGLSGGYAGHTGIDLRAFPRGSNIYAAESGIVQYAGPDNENKANYSCIKDPNNKAYSPLCAEMSLNQIGAYGFMVKILHPNGKSTLYAHNSELKVKTGDCVNKGDLIALSGSVGNSTDVHLHFEVRKNATCTWDGNSLGTCTEDPANYLVKGASNVSVFTNEQVKSVCNGVLPPTDPDEDQIVCRPTGEDNDDDRVGNPGTPQAGGVACIVKAAAESLTRQGIPTNPYMMYAILRQETQGQLNPLQGENDFICPATWQDWRNGIRPLCSGDPNQTAFASFNGYNPPNIDVRGLTQFYSATFNGTVANALTEMTACVQDVGINNTIDNDLWRDPLSNYPGQFSRHRVGDAICVQGIKLMKDARSFNGGAYLSVEQWLEREDIIRLTAGRYYGACQDGYCENVIRYFNEAVQAQVFENLDCSGGSDGGTTPGTLSCSIDTKNTGQSIDFAKSKSALEVYVRSYNLDSNNSYTWFANPDSDETSTLRDRIINFLGSQDAYNKDHADRLEVTNYLLEQAAAKGINPLLALVTWQEESAFSALGSHALGCGVNVAIYSEIPYMSAADRRDSNKKAQLKQQMKDHLSQQLDCLEAITDKTSNFNEFMCTYSGEPATDGTATQCSDRANFGTIGANGVRSCNKFICNPNFPRKWCEYLDWY